MSGVRAFIAIAGLVFALIFAAHLARLAEEGSGLLREPIFVATSLVSLGAAIWSAILLRKRRLVE